MLFLLENLIKIITIRILKIRRIKDVVWTLYTVVIWIVINYDS